MHNLWTIFKKEIYRVVSDRRLVVMVFILPGLSIFIMYSLMGNILAQQVTSVQEHRIVLYQEHMPDSLQAILTTQDDNGQATINLQILEGVSFTQDELETKLLSGEVDIALIFDADFETIIRDYNQQAAPEMNIYYNYGRNQSSFAYNRIAPMLAQYRELMLIERLADPEDYLVFQNHVNHIVDERQVAGQGMAALLPMLIVIFLFAGAMSIGPDAIAGEKERGTMATLLVTPTKRSDIALGKVTSLAVLSLASALSSFIGILLSLPKLMQAEGQNFNIYGVSDYLFILFVLMATVLVIVGLISILSAYANTVKEASMFIMPLYFVTIIIGILSSFGQEASQSVWTHLIPLYGSVNLLNAIFTFHFNFINFLVVIISSVIYTGIMIYVLNLMFKSEKIMFQK